MGKAAVGILTPGAEPELTWIVQFFFNFDLKKVGFRTY